MLTFSLVGIIATIGLVALAGNRKSECDDMLASTKAIELTMDVVDKDSPEHVKLTDSFYESRKVHDTYCNGLLGSYSHRTEKYSDSN